MREQNVRNWIVLNGSAALAFVLVASSGSIAVAQQYAQSEAAQSSTSQTPSLFDDQIQAQLMSKPIQLDRVVFMGSRNQVVGRHGFALGCIKTHGPLLLNSGRVNADPTVYADIFREVLGAASYNVVGDTGALFTDREADTAEFLIGGLITRFSVDICDALIGFGQSGKASMDVEWQVYSPLQRQVVYKTTTSGEAKSRSQTNGGVVAIHDAFTQAARGLISDDGFNKLVFDLSINQSVAASTPEDITTIAKVPMSTSSFQDGITLTRARVATIVTGSGSGSGFFISDDMLLTNEHVVGGSSVVVVRLVTGREIVGEVVATNSARDVAILRTESLGLGGLPLRPGEVTVGSPVFVIGSPLGEQNESTVSAGIVSAYRTEGELRYIQSDVNVMGGNSGGPMFDDKGNVIGITVQGAMVNNVSVGLNRFIPIGDALTALNVRIEGDAS